MVVRWPGASRWVAVLLTMPALCLVAMAADDARPTEAPTRTATKKFAAKKGGATKKLNAAKQAPGPELDRREAAEIFQALREIADAVEREDRGAAKSKPEDVLRALGRSPKSVTPPTLDAAGLDALIDKALATSKSPAARRTSDEAFLRRAALDLTGKPPTEDQVRAFVLNPAKDKRSKLIDAYLNSPEYAANWARYWRDVFKYRATVDNPRLLDFPKLESWLAERFAAKAPWDEIVTELLTATGDSEANPASVFTAAHMAQPNEVAGEVSRVFLGVQIQCAECHDHPSDVWKRQQFHEFAAFFANVQARRRPNADNPGIEIVNRPGVPRYTMPDLNDPQNAIAVEPKFFLASSEMKVPPRTSAALRRTIAASYVVGQDNPWFAKAFVNRVWYVLMGDAFFNPVDDLGPTREPNHPEIIEALASQFQQGGYDIAWLFRTIMNTKAYQRESRSTGSITGRTPLASNCPSRLRSDQIYDALEALGARLGPVRGMARGGGAQGAAAILRRLGPRGLFENTFGYDPSTPNEDVLGTIPQALFLMNSPSITGAVQARPGSVLGEILESTPDNRAALEALYLKVLSRRPTPKEVELCGAYLAQVGNRREAFEDIFWGLINSTEFISRR